MFNTNKIAKEEVKKFHNYIGARLFGNDNAGCLNLRTPDNSEMDNYYYDKELKEAYTLNDSLFSVFPGRDYYSTRAKYGVIGELFQRVNDLTKELEKQKESCKELIEASQQLLADKKSKRRSSAKKSTKKTAKKTTKKKAVKKKR